MLFKKLIYIIIVLAVTVLIFTVPKSGSSDKVVIKFASWGSKSEVDIIKPILKEFEEKNPDLKVDFMHIPQNYFQKIHLLFASNTAPDVIFINNLYLPIYANAGLLMPVQEDYAELEKVFYPKALIALSWNGELYAIPRDISNLVIYYNKDIFDKYNIAYPNSGWTFDDFLKTAQKLTHKPQIFGVSFDEESLYYLPFVMSEGGGILSDNLSELIIDSKESRKGLDFYADLRKKYDVAPKKNESASATMAQMFLQERLAMHLSGRWLTPKYREEAKFDWDVAAFPKGDKGSIVPMDASGWAVAKSSKHPAEAKKLVEFLSSKESIEKFAESGLIVPARIDVANSKYFLDNKKPQNAKAFLETIETSKPTPVSVNYNEILDKLKEKLEYKFN